MNIYEKLLAIQTELKAPKNQYNSFGKYNYRSCEDILEGLKPLLEKYKATLILNDEVVQIGDRYYIKATAYLLDVEKDQVNVSAYAREDETKKGMDLAQVTGSTSSYARKYALNGLFAIDDTKDSDATNQHGKEQGQAPTPTPATIESKPEPTKMPNKSLTENQIKRLYAIASGVGVNADTVKAQVKTKFNKEVNELTKPEYDTVCKGYEGLKK